MGRPRKGQKVTTVQVSFRLDASLAKAMDMLAVDETALTGYPVTRADVARRAIREWVEVRARERKR